MAMEQKCPECGALWTDSLTCLDDFHQMLFWESEDNSLWEVHHLMVLCYHLQHPSLYSPDGLTESMQLLVNFITGVTTQEIRRRNRDVLDSGNRKFKITARADSKGAYAHPVEWTMTAGDVVAGGMEQYVANVRVWAQSVYEALQASGNLA